MRYVVKSKWILAALALAGAVVAAAGCMGPWLDPDDPAAVDLACGDLRAAMATLADGGLEAKGASAAEALRVAAIFEKMAEAVRDGSAGAAADALIDALAAAIEDPRDYDFASRLIRRVAERVDARAKTLAEADEDARAGRVARMLTVAALDGLAAGAREYAAAQQMVIPHLELDLPADLFLSSAA